MTPDLVPHLFSQTTYWCYRFSAYVLMNLIDDAALMAMMFCS